MDPDVDHGENLPVNRASPIQEFFTPPSQRRTPEVVTLEDDDDEIEITFYSETRLTGRQSRDADEKVPIAVTPTENAPPRTSRASSRASRRSRPPTRAPSSETDSGIPDQQGEGRRSVRAAKAEAAVKLVVQYLPARTPRSSYRSCGSRPQSRLSSRRNSVSELSQLSEGEDEEVIDEQKLAREVHKVVHHLEDHIKRRIEYCKNATIYEQGAKTQFVDYMTEKIEACQKLLETTTGIRNKHLRNGHDKNGWSKEPMSLIEHEECITRKDLAVLKGFIETIKRELFSFNSGSWWCNFQNADEELRRLNKDIEDTVNEVNDDDFSLFAFDRYSLCDVAECPGEDQKIKYAEACNELKSCKGSTPIVSLIKACHKNAEMAKTLGDDYDPIMRELSRLLSEIQSGYRPPKGKYFRRLFLNVAQFIVYENNDWMVRRWSREAFYGGVPTVRP